jgi:hypothetical protein
MMHYIDVLISLVTRKSENEVVILESDDDMGNFTSKHHIEVNKLNHDEINRLKYVVEHHICQVPSSPRENASSFPSFATELRKFRNVNNWLVNDDHCRLFGDLDFYNRNDKLLLLRVTPSNELCSLIAPAVLQHYLVSLDCLRKGLKFNFSMIDTLGFINKYWKSDRIANFIERDHGESSIYFLRDITKEADQSRLIIPSIQSQSLHDDTCNEIFRKLKSGPALVSMFRVYEKFVDSEEISFTANNMKETDRGAFLGFHSMVLIGMRKPITVGGEYTFLLQNWWLDKLFVEVSSSYMAMTGAFIVFVKSNLTSIPDEFPAVNASYAETIDIKEDMLEY